MVQQSGAETANQRPLPDPPPLFPPSVHLSCYTLLLPRRAAVFTALSSILLRELEGHDSKSEGRQNRPSRGTRTGGDSMRGRVGDGAPPLATENFADMRQEIVSLVEQPPIPHRSPRLLLS